MKVFDLDDYKKGLRVLLEKKKQESSESRRWTFAKMAEACRVQKTYLSRMMRDAKTHLNSDQLFLACEYLELSQEERRYLLLLLEYERSTIEKRKRELRTRIESMQAKNRRTESAMESGRTRLHRDVDLFSAYYLNPDLQLLHMYLTVPAYASSPERARERLQWSNERFKTAFARLEELGLIRREGRVAVVTERRMHLAADSPVLPAYRNLIRLRALQRLESEPRKEDYSFSVLLSANPEVRKRIHRGFIEYVASIQKLVDESDPSAVYQMNFDLFEW